jgi:5'-nucleotidase/UDP-sugar diphosphatase
VIADPESDHKTLIVQAWEWGLVLGRVDLFVQRGRVIDYKFQAIPLNLKRAEKRTDGTKVYQFIGDEIPEDPKLLALLEPYAAEVDSLFSEVIGHAEATFFVGEVREKETPLGNLIADSMLWYTKYLGVDFALQNGGGIRADLPKGPITKGAIHATLPFDNSVVVLTLKGSTVQALCDYMATISSGEGAFPQVSDDLSLTIDNLGKRCEKILMNGEPLKVNKAYRVATNSYLAAGGDGYRMLLNVIDKYDCAILAREVLTKYIRHLGGTIKPQVTGRINFIDSLSYFIRTVKYL